MLKWFKEREYKMLEVKSGSNHTVVKAKDKDGNLEFFGLCGDEDSTKHFGKNQVTSQYKHYIYKIDVKADKIASFACTKNSTLFLLAKKEEDTSMDPENPKS